MNARESSLLLNMSVSLSVSLSEIGWLLRSYMGGVACGADCGVRMDSLGDNRVSPSVPTATHSRVTVSGSHRQAHRDSSGQPSKADCMHIASNNNLPKRRETATAYIARVAVVGKATWSYNLAVLASEEVLNVVF